MVAGGGGRGGGEGGAHTHTHYTTIKEPYCFVKAGLGWRVGFPGQGQVRGTPAGAGRHKQTTFKFLYFIYVYA